MDNYNEYIEERLLGMYSLIESSNNVLLEGIMKKKTSEEMVQKNKRAFMNYLVMKYRDPNIKREFKEAETDKEKQAIINKYQGDFNEWAKRQKGLLASLKISLVGLGMSITGIGGSIPIFMSYLCWGIIIKTLVDDISTQRQEDERRYNETHKK